MSYLLRRRDNKRCCVGIYLKACGIDDDTLRGLSAACEVAACGTQVPDWLLSEDGVYSSGAAEKLYQDNDFRGGRHRRDL